MKLFKAIKKVFLGLSWGLTTWFILSYIEVVSKNLTTADYSPLNLFTILGL